MTASIATRYTLPVIVRGELRAHVHIEAAEHEQDPGLLWPDEMRERAGLWVVYSTDATREGLGYGPADLWSTARDGFTTWKRGPATLFQLDRAMKEAQLAAACLTGRWERCLREEEEGDKCLRDVHEPQQVGCAT